MNTKYIHYFSNLRAIACFAIVVLHGFFIPLTMYECTVSQRMVSMVVRNCMLWAVPCFVMVTGALLLTPDHQVSGSHIFKRYIPRIILALVIFSFVFELFDFFTLHEIAPKALIPDWLLKLWTDGSWLHMWYLYMLLGLYLMTPVFRLITEKASRETLIYLIIILFLFLSVMSTINTLTGKTSGFYISFYSIYPLYYFLGYALHSGKISLDRKISWILFLTGTALILLVTVSGILLSSQVLSSLGSNYSFCGVVLQAAGIFSLMKGSETNFSKKPHPFLKKVDGCSFGIYLVHVLFLYVFYRVLEINPYQYGSYAILVMAGVTVSSFAASMLVVWIFRKVMRKS